MCKALEAPAQVKDERPRFVFLEIGDEKVQEERFASTCAPQNHGVGHVVMMEVEKVRRVVVCFEDRQIFLTEMLVPRLATVESEQKGIIGVI